LAEIEKVAKASYPRGIGASNSRRMIKAKAFILPPYLLKKEAEMPFLLFIDSCIF